MIRKFYEFEGLGGGGKDKAPDWFNMNLSELVDKSLALKVIPFFQFIDKDKVAVGETPSKPFWKISPIDVLKKEIRSFGKTIDKISEMVPENDEQASKLRQLQRTLKRRQKVFQKAIDILSPKP